MAGAGIRVGSVTHDYSYRWVSKGGRCKSFVQILIEIKYTTFN